jgi:small subunit ribosomal protein S18
MKTATNIKTNSVLSLSQLLARKQKKTKSKTPKPATTAPMGTNFGGKPQVVTPIPTIAQGTTKSRSFSSGLPTQDNRTTKVQKPIKPLIPTKSLIILLKDKPEKTFYNRRLIDYKNTGLLQYYIGLGGKLLPRRQTRLSAKQQRFIAKTVKSARVMGLLPFVSKERGFFR